MTNRREFLQTTAAIAGSLILPTNLLATPSPNLHFLHTDTLNSWLVTDPVQWSLQNANEPILERAADGLKKLTTSNGDRIVRLVVRRCSLNLLEVHEHRVHVQFWGTKGQADLKPFFKTHGRARQEIRVELRDLKKEVTSTKFGDSFLYGVPIASDFPLELFREKWTRRFENEPDDLSSAPVTASGFAWNGLPDGLIPWAVLKSAWRRSQSVSCLNCDHPTILVNFGLKQVGLFNRSPNFVSVCPKCQRSFVDDSIKDAPGWMKANIHADFWPGYEMMWGKRVKLETSS